MKTLVTGATGFLGTSLVERLCERGDDVVCVAKDSLNMRDLERLKVQIVLGDLNDVGSYSSILKDVSYVFHLAGATRAKNWQEYYDSNYVATKRFVDVCAQKATQLKRLVHVSSIAAVGPSSIHTPLTEDSPLRPVSDYGKSKMLGEIEALKAKERLPLTVIRPSSIYGPRERDMYDIFRAVKRGVLPMLGFQEKRVSALYSDDLISGMLQAAESQKSIGETYFLGSDQFYAPEEVGAAIAKAAGANPFRIRVPHFLLYAAGAAAQIGGKITRQQVFLNIQKVRELVQPGWICSVQKAKEHFGYRQNVSLEDGMERTHRWYVDNGWL